MGRIISRCCFRVCVVLAFATPTLLHAQTQPSSFFEPDLLSPRAEKPFPSANWEFFGGVQGLTTYTPRSQSLGFFTLGAGYLVLDNVSVNAELGVSPGNLQCESRTVRAWDGMFLARWYALHTGRLSLFIDGGVGALHAEHFVGAASRSACDARYAHITGGSALSSQGRPSAEAVQYGLSLLIVK
jgi:hypothetical protein